MVKFVEGDHNYDIVVDKLLDICKHDELGTPLRNSEDLPFDTADPNTASDTPRSGRLKVWSHDGAVT